MCVCVCVYVCGFVCMYHEEATGLRTRIDAEYHYWQMIDSLPTLYISC